MNPLFFFFITFNIHYNDCITFLESMNLTVIMSAHVFTSISLFKLAATYRIYREGYLLFEQSELIDTLEFPIIICKKLVPITTPTNYSIEATIFGPMAGFPIGITLFEGVKYARLVPGTDNNITISMLYIGNCYLYLKKNFYKESHTLNREKSWQILLHVLDLRNRVHEMQKRMY